jgi:PPOX class probable F420-dependent enzyme
MANFKSALGKKAKKLLEIEYILWLTTIDANLTPQPRPVWFVPDGDDVVIYSKPHTAKVGHIRLHPNVSLHFNTDHEANDPVMVLVGTAILDDNTPVAKDFEPYMKKYKSGIVGIDLNPTDFTKAYAQPIRVKITNIRGW